MHNNFNSNSFYYLLQGYTGIKSAAHPLGNGFQRGFSTQFRVSKNEA